MVKIEVKKYSMEALKAVIKAIDNAPKFRIKTLDIGAKTNVVIFLKKRIVKMYCKGYSAELIFSFMRKNHFPVQVTLKEIEACISEYVVCKNRVAEKRVFVGINKLKGE